SWSIVAMIGFDRIGRDRFIACGMIRASVALSAKTSAKAPPQEPCRGSKAARARGRQLARGRWRRRFVGGVARSAGLMSHERGNNRPVAGPRLINCGRPSRRYGTCPLNTSSTKVLAHTQNPVSIRRLPPLVVFDYAAARKWPTARAGFFTQSTIL